MEILKTKPIIYLNLKILGYENKRNFLNKENR